MGLRVLVAEDEALVALSLADFLEGECYEVVLAHNGADVVVEAAAMAAEGHERQKIDPHEATQLFEKRAQKFLPSRRMGNSAAAASSSSRVPS
jgi:CheY-like chemotaxis protein